MKVEPFERLTTSVWTLRLSKRVGSAFGMRAASALSSSGSGLSVTAAASGSRKSIFATAGSIPRPSRDQPLLQNGSMQESSLSPRTTHVLGRLRHLRLWLLLVLGSVAIVLFPWTA